MLMKAPGRITAEDPEAVALAADALREGLVIALPTDTVYGLAVDPSRAHAVERLFALKARPSDVALPVLVGTREQAESVTGGLDALAGRLAGWYWPGPLTVVVPRGHHFVADLGGPPSARTTVGVRLPAHSLVEGLCREVGPLAVTSANIHGDPPATAAHEVMESFPECDGIGIVVDGGRCDGTPSTVVECRGGTLRCLREGAIPWSEILGRRRDASAPG